MQINSKIIFFLCLILFSSFTFAFSGTGTGTPSDPFVVLNCNQLQEIKNDTTKHYVQGNNIDCSVTSTWNTGAGFEPIAIGYGYFKGSFDGKRYKITNLFINRPTTNGIGLFGSTDIAGVLKNINLINVNITGSTYVGGIVGYNMGTLSTSSATGAVKTPSSPNTVGGLIGQLTSGLLENSYYIGTSKTGSINAPLLAGCSASPVMNSYAVGVGPIIGCNFPIGTPTKSFLSSALANPSEYYGASGIPFSTWDWNTTYWTPIDNNFPSLKKKWEGTGTLGDPWVITTCLELQDMNLKINGGNYALGKDIDCYTETHAGGALWNGGAGFFPIGTDTNNFIGTLDGRNFVISNLYINKNTNNTGLFGSINSSTIKNLGLKDFNIIGVGSTGSLAGQVNSSLIKNTFATGVVNGGIGSGVGGLIGSLRGGTSTPAIIINSFFDGNVKGFGSVGGLIGSALSVSTIKNTFVKGNVDGHGTGIGGITGWNNGMSGINNVNIINSYNLANIINPNGSQVGGITGNNDAYNCSIYNSFSIGIVTGLSEVDKVVGYHSTQGHLNNLYCLSSGIETRCTTTLNKSDFYSSTYGVYNGSLLWNDGNWIWRSNSFPRLTAFPYCNGPIDGNAIMYEMDGDGFISKDENTNILVNSNTSRKCQYYCKTGYFKGTGVDENKCVPNQCSGAIDSNAIIYLNDDFNLQTNNILRTLTQTNDANKCQYYCRTGFYQTGNTCTSYDCTGTIDGNSIICTNDNTELPSDGTKILVETCTPALKCEYICKPNFFFDSNNGTKKCLPIKYNCLGTPDNNSLLCPNDNLDLDKNYSVSLVSSNANCSTPTKCEYYCKLGFYKGSGLDENKCVPYQCTGNVDTNSTLCENDNIELDLNHSKLLVPTCTTTEKCEYFCTPPFDYNNGFCIKSNLNQNYCTGLDFNNAEIYVDDNVGLIQSIAKTLTNSNTATKCQYHCKTGYKIYNNTCIPLNWIIPICGTAIGVYPIYTTTDTFPKGPYCSLGSPNPTNPILANTINASANWKCVSDVNISCNATRVDESYSSCSILSLDANVSAKGLYVNAKCSCDTQADLTFINYENSTNLGINQPIINCNTITTTTGIGFSTPITQETLIQIKANIENYVPECTTCELTTFLSYVPYKEEVKIPDNSLIFVLLILIISIAIIQKKRI